MRWGLYYLAEIFNSATGKLQVFLIKRWPESRYYKIYERYYDEWHFYDNVLDWGRTSICNKKGHVFSKYPFEKTYFCNRCARQLKEVLVEKGLSVKYFFQ